MKAVINLTDEEVKKLEAMLDYKVTKETLEEDIKLFIDIIYSVS